MALFNRLVVTLLALATLVTAATFVAVPDIVLGALDASLSALRGATTESLTWGGSIIAAVAGFVALLEVWPRREQQVLKAIVDNGTVIYRTETVARIAEQSLAGVPGVEGTQRSAVEARGSGQKVDLHVRLVVHEWRDPQAIAAEVAGRVREKVEKGLGLKLHSLQLAIETAAPASLVEEAQVREVA